MLKNIIHSTYPKTIHCPQCNVNDPFLNFLICKLKNSKILANVPSELEIISWDNNVQNSTLKKSVDFLKIKSTFLGNGVLWNNNKIKIDLTNEFLKKTKSRYTMGIDSHDALIFGNPEDILNQFKLMNCKLIFNATVTSYPPVAELTNYETNVFNNGIWRYLNAGVWIGETEYCRYFFNKILSYQDKANSLYKIQSNEESKMGEQILVRLALIDEYPNVLIDNKCELFQIIRETEIYPKELKVHRGVEINGIELGKLKI